MGNREVILKITDTNKVFNAESGRTFTFYIHQAKKCLTPITQKNWLGIPDSTNIDEVLIKIFYCFLNQINFIIVAPNEIRRHSNNQNLEPKIMEEIPVWEELVLSKDVNQLKISTEFSLVLQNKIGIKTSGSSGTPKIIVHEMSSLIYNAKEVLRELHHDSKKIWNISLPIFHLAGLSIILRSLINNSPIQKLSKIDLSEKNISGTISLVSAQIESLLTNSQVSPENLTIMIGGGKTNPQLLQKLLEKNFTVYSTYGMSEFGPTISTKKLDLNSNLNSCGTPLKNTTIKIIDKRLAIQGPSCFEGILDPQLNIIPATLTDGFFISNDLAEIIENEIFISSRIDKIFVSGGKNISLNEINNQLSALLIQNNFWTISYPSEKWGETYGIIIQLKSNISEDKKRLVDLINKNLTGIYRPDQIAIIDEAHTFSGIKPSRDELMEIINKNQSIVFLPGLFGNKDEFRDLNLEQYLNLNLSCIEYEYPILEFVPYVHLIHQKILKLNLKNPILCGFSQGGRIAFYLKYFYPDYYKKVICISAQAICVENVSDRKIIDQNRLKKITTEEEFNQFLENFFNSELYSYIYSRQSFRNKLEQIKFSKIDLYQELFSKLSVTNQPDLDNNLVIDWNDLHFICGDHDNKYQQIGEKIHQIIPGLKIYRIKNAGHAVHIDNPKETNKIIHQIVAQKI